MKRFWKAVSVEYEEDGWALKLDGRPVKTPARALLVAPTKALAEAIADEWRAVEETIDPRAMPLTGLANAAIDRVAPAPQAFAASLATYAETDLTCYRATGPRELVDLQNTAWDTLQAWARRRYDVDFAVSEGVIHVAQPEATVERLSHAIGALDPFRLAGLSPIIAIGGSAVAALALIEGAITPLQAWDAISIDDRWQMEQWGSDPEAEVSLENRRRDFMAAARFLELLET
jgi:chaperone required for assembly of F1-ATPase